MNRSTSLEDMLDAGIRSFKIEGRLKDPAYVKNVTAYYRRALDAIIARRPEAYVRASRGIHQLSFAPNVAKSFNRGFTDYFLHERTVDLWNFNTPKSMGEYVGTVQRVGSRSLKCRFVTPVNNGDGLVYLNADGHLEGFRANRVEDHEVYPLKMPAVAPGSSLYRNEDRAWETLLAGKTAERRLPLSLTLSVSGGRYIISGHLSFATSSSATEADSSVNSAPSSVNSASSSPNSAPSSEDLPFSLSFDHEVQQAQRPQDDNIRQNLSKLGDTPFVAASVTIDTPFPCFIPASVLGKMRRQFVEAYVEYLQHHHLETRDLRRASSESPALDLSNIRYTYASNVANGVARRWLYDHGARNVAPAFEIERPAGAALMTCRHCLRYSFGQCPKVTGHRPTWAEPLTLRLPDQRSFPLHFDCSRCEMQVLMPATDAPRSNRVE